MKTWLLLLVGIKHKLFWLHCLSRGALALLIGNQNYAPGVGGLTKPHGHE